MQQHCSPSRSFPILVYFKETQTPEEFWNVGPGEQANSEEAIAKGAGKMNFAYLRGEVSLYITPNNVQMIC